MRYTNFLLTAFFLLASVASCQKDESVALSPDTGIEGRVYSIGAPPVLINWTPPPLEAVSTIIVLDRNKTPAKEATTDDKGRFKILLPSGIYFLRVKESLLPAETGPYEVTEGRFVSVEAHYDNGVR